MSTKYLLTGNAVEVLHQVNGGHIVCDLYESDDGEQSGHPRFTDEKLFENPPVEKLELRVDELNKQIESLLKQHSFLCKEVSETKNKHASLMSGFKNIPALEFLQEFIEGKITHLVIDSDYYSPKVVEFDKEMQSDEERHVKKLKLLTLFGASNGDLQWRMGKYSDGSGSSWQVFPFTSKEAAIAKAKECCETHALATQDRPQERIITAALEFGATLPEGYHRKFMESCVKGNSENIAKDQAALDKRKSELETQKENLASLA